MKKIIISNAGYRYCEELGTQVAPLWTIIAISILLTGVWSHYVYVVVHLFRVKRIARKEAMKNLV